METDFQRIRRLPPYVFNIVGEMKAAARARGEDIIDFSMGNPDQPTPKHIVDKLTETAQRGDTHRYSQSRGIPRLRKAMTDWYQRRYDVELDPESEAIVTIGSKEGLAHLALATMGPGDTVLVPNPSYPIHPYGFVISNADIRHVPMVKGVDFFVELERAIKESWPKPKMLVLNFPGNPRPSVWSWISSRKWWPLPVSTRSGWCTISPTRISCSTVTRPPRSFRWKVRRMWRWSSFPCPRDRKSVV